VGFFAKGRQDTAAKIERHRQEQAEAERATAVAVIERLKPPAKTSKSKFVNMGCRTASLSGPGEASRFISIKHPLPSTAA
jgi:hypothetical protein